MSASDAQAAQSAPPDQPLPPLTDDRAHPLPSVNAIAPRTFKRVDTLSRYANYKPVLAIAKKPFRLASIKANYAYNYTMEYIVRQLFPEYVDNYEARRVKRFTITVHSPHQFTRSSGIILVMYSPDPLVTHPLSSINDDNGFFSYPQRASFASTTPRDRKAKYAIQLVPTVCYNLLAGDARHNNEGVLTITKLLTMSYGGSLSEYLTDAEFTLAAEVEFFCPTKIGAANSISYFEAFPEFTQASIVFDHAFETALVSLEAVFQSAGQITTIKPILLKIEFTVDTVTHVFAITTSNAQTDGQQLLITAPDLYKLILDSAISPILANLVTFTGSPYWLASTLNYTTL